MLSVCLFLFVIDILFKEPVHLFWFPCQFDGFAQHCLLLSVHRAVVVRVASDGVSTLLDSDLDGEIDYNSIRSRIGRVDFSCDGFTAFITEGAAPEWHRNPFLLRLLFSESDSVQVNQFKIDSALEHAYFSTL